MKDFENKCKETCGIWQSNVLKEIYTLKYEKKIDKILKFDRTESVSQEVRKIAKKTQSK